MMLRAHPSDGFSYIELLVCTAIILILYALYLGPSSAAGQAKRKAECAQHLQQMHLSLALYAQEHNGTFPVRTDASSSEQPLSLLVPQYTSDTSVFICPAGRQAKLPEAQVFDNRRISYSYYMGVRADAGPSVPLVSDAQVDTTTVRPIGTPLFAEKRSATGGNHVQYGGNVLFADGHVESFPNRVTRDLDASAGVKLLNPKP